MLAMTTDAPHDADYHERCDSRVRISLKDLNGPFAGTLSEQKHPDTTRYPNVNVAWCQLAAGHDDRCEMFVDGAPGEPYRGHWLAWQRETGLVTTYEWIVQSECCPAEGPNGYGCGRYVDHTGGHSFTAGLA
jgi:hypothetical protein